MAIYHTHISSGSRDDGQSAAVKVAYILREGAYGGRHDLVTSGSGNMPAWASTDPRRLFEAADLYERANGRLFVHVWVALPNELNAPQRHQSGARHRHGADGGETSVRVRHPRWRPEI